MITTFLEAEGKLARHREKAPTNIALKHTA